MSDIWTDSRKSRLCELWDAGFTSPEIVTILGGGLTRSAVMGQVHRLGLSSRNNRGRNPTPSARLIRDMDRLAEQLEQGRSLALAATRLGMSIEMGEVLFDRIVEGLGKQAA